MVFPTLFHVECWEPREENLRDLQTTEIKFLPMVKGCLRLRNHGIRLALEAEELATTARSSRLEWKYCLLNMTPDGIQRKVLEYGCRAKGKWVNRDCNGDIRDRYKTLNMERVTRMTTTLQLSCRHLLNLKLILLKVFSFCSVHYKLSLITVLKLSNSSVAKKNSE